MNKLLLFMFVCFASLSLSAQSDLFFSEYIEGSGNNKALEIYNPTNQTIDLSKYSVARYSNGDQTYTNGGITQLAGTIGPYKTFILVNGQTEDQTTPVVSPKCDPILQALGNQLDHAYPAPTYMNGNDAIALLKLVGSALTPVDLIGQIGLGDKIKAESGWSSIKDTAITYNSTSGGVTTSVTGKITNYIVLAKSSTNSGELFWLNWTANHTLIRKPTVIKGVVSNPNPFIVTKEWDTLPAVMGTDGKQTYEDIWTNLGKHRCVADPDFYTSLDKGKVSGSQISVYPNPVVSDRFTVSSQLPVSEIEIFSVIGRSIFHKEFKQGQQQVELESLNLDKGVYLVKVTSPNKITSVKKILVK